MGSFIGVRIWICLFYRFWTFVHYSFFCLQYATSIGMKPFPFPSFFVCLFPSVFSSCSFSNWLCYCLLYCYSLNHLLPLKHHSIIQRLSSHYHIPCLPMEASNGTVEGFVSIYRPIFFNEKWKNSSAMWPSYWPPSLAHISLSFAFLLLVSLVPPTSRFVPVHWHDSAYLW